MSFSEPFPGAESWVASFPEMPNQGSMKLEDGVYSTGVVTAAESEAGFRSGRSNMTGPGRRSHSDPRCEAESRRNKLIMEICFF